MSLHLWGVLTAGVLAFITAINMSVIGHRQRAKVRRERVATHSAVDVARFEERLRKDVDWVAKAFGVPSVLLPTPSPPGPRPFELVGACPKCWVEGLHLLGDRRPAWDAHGQHEQIDRECFDCGKTWSERAA